MPHVTFIHGILNKPPKEHLIKQWTSALSNAAAPFDLDAAGVTYEMVYWADVLYEKPDPIELHESTAPEEQSLEKLSFEELRVTEKVGASPEEAAWLNAMRQRLGVENDGELIASEEDPHALQGTMANDLERIPLPWPIKKAFMQTFLRDVHHYLFNENFSPRAGVNYDVQDEIRRRFVNAIEAGNKKGGTHVVISHSMGTVIAYDCLKRVPECPAVSHLITLGSPLGIDEVQDKLHPEWTRDDGFPSEKLGGKWLNFFDPFDVVSRLDPYLASDYRQGGAQIIQDTKQHNGGPTPHDLGGYMRGTSVSKSIQSFFG